MTRYGEIRSYRDLLIWQKGMALAKQIYAVTRTFPGDERFGMMTSLRGKLMARLATNH